MEILGREIFVLVNSDTSQVLNLSINGTHGARDSELPVSGIINQRLVDSWPGQHSCIGKEIERGALVVYV